MGIFSNAAITAGGGIGRMKLDWKTCIRIGVTAVATYLIIHYWTGFTSILGTALQAAMPLIAGCTVAYVVNILMGFYERHLVPNSNTIWVQKCRRPVCMLLAYVSVILVIVALFSVVLPELAAAIALLIERLPGAISSALQWLDETLQLHEWLKVPQWDWRSTLEKGLELATEYFGGIMSSAIMVMTGVVSGVVTAFICIVFSVYLLTCKDRLRAQSLRLMRLYLGQRRTDGILRVLVTLNRSFHNYISGQCMESAILGLLCLAGMLIFRFPYAAMVSALMGFTALIPVAGAYIGAIIGAFMIFTVSPLQALLFLIFLVVLQQFEGNVIFPRVVGSSIGLPGVWVLAAVTIGGGLFGIAGMLLGVPLAATAYQLLREDMRRRELPKNA